VCFGAAHSKPLTIAFLNWPIFSRNGKVLHKKKLTCSFLLTLVRCRLLRQQQTHNSAEEKTPMRACEDETTTHSIRTIIPPFSVEKIK
jgi:hypothetical protein